MAVPAYTTDLSSQVINACDSNSTPQTWTNLGTGADTTETDYFIQNTACISKPFNITTGGLYVTTAGHTIASGQCYWAWYYFGCPNALLGETAGGLQALIGASSSSYDTWDVLGSDSYTYGGWRCIPIDPNNIGYDDRVGAGATSFVIFGVYARTSTGIGKGNPLGIDILRYGYGEARIADGSTADGYATFVGFATQNDNIANRWGLIQSIDGGYLVQGKVIFGYSTAVDFRDENISLLIANTKKVQADFNAFEVRQSGSKVYLTAVSILSLGTTARGNWITTDNADIDLTNCTFTDMGTFDFLSNSTILNTVFRRTDKITTGGATLTGCTIDSNRATTAVLCANPAQAALISNSDFTSDGSSYGIEITGTAADITLTGNNFTSYEAYQAGGTTTGNEAIFVNIASGVMVITISGGSTPSYRTAGCTVTISSGYTLTLTGLVTLSDIVILNAGTSTERVNVNENSGTTYGYGYTDSGSSVDICVFKAGYIPFFIRAYTLPTSNSSLPINQVVDRNYLE